MMNALLTAAAAASLAAAPLPVPPLAGATLRDVQALEAAVLAAPAPQHVRADPRDPWLSEDKFRHVAGSWTMMVFSYAATRSVADADAALAVAVPATAAAGLAKEVFDRRAGGPFSLRDLLADAVGATAAWLVLREVR